MPDLSVRRWLLAIGAMSLILGLSAAAAPTTVAQGFDLSGAPVDVHVGSCQDALTEPAYFGGNVEMTSLSALGEDEFLNAGLFRDEAAGAVGVDLNGDDQLAETEIIGGIDQDVPVAVAQDDLGEDIDLSQQLVVALHAGPDTYTTILACGAIAEAVEGEGSRTLSLNPVGNSGVFGFSVIEGDQNTIHSYLFQQGTVPSTPPPSPPQASVEGFPVGIHSGDCTNWTVEPAYDADVFQQTNVAAPDEQAPGDQSAATPPAAAALGPMHKVEGELGEDDSGQTLLDEGPYIVGVHESAENYETLVACGPVLEIIEGDDLLVPLKPVGDSNYTGTVLINRENGDLTGYLWECEPLQQQVVPTPTPSPTATTPPTPTPTPTQIPTAVIEETEVVRETEVVLAPTATAEARQPGESQVIDLGEEPVPLTGQAGQPIAVNNPSDAERVFRVPDLGIEQPLPAGQQAEIQVPAEAQPGTYTYEVVEGGQVVYQGELTIE